MREGDTNAINTSGGTSISGNVNVQGNLIGRDNITNHNYYAPKQLAVAVARDPRVRMHFSDGVLWAGLGPQGDALIALGQWVDALGVDVSQLADAPARAQAVCNAIGQRKLLIVIDDAWSADAAEALRCGGPGCCHLLTTRDTTIARTFAGVAHASKVPTLPHDEAFALLRALAPEACAADPAAARALVVQVGGLPLAVELLGGYLAAPERSLFSELSAVAFAELADPQRRLQLASTRLGAEAAGPQSLRVVIELSLSGLPDGVRQAFYALGAFAASPESFDLDAAKYVGNCSAETMATLVKRNLVQLRGNGDELFVHPVLSDVAKTRMDETAIKRHCAYYFLQVDSQRGNWKLIERLYAQLRHACFSVPDDSVSLNLIGILQSYQEVRGLWSDYLVCARHGLSIAQRQKWNTQISVFLNNIGRAFAGKSMYSQALPYYEQSLQEAIKLEDKQGVVTLLNNIGRVYDAQNDMAKALEYFGCAIAVARENQDPKGHAVTLNNIGVSYGRRGDYDMALPHYLEALQLRDSAADRFGKAKTLTNVADVYEQQGKWRLAIDRYTEALHIYQEIGNLQEQKEILVCMTNLFAHLGKYEDAINCLQTAAPIMVELGDDLGLSWALINLTQFRNALEE